MDATPPFQQNTQVNSTRRFLLKNLLFRPSVLMPMIGGIACAVASWLMGGNVYLTSLAIVGTVGSLAWMLTRTFLNVEDLTDQAKAAERQAARDAENRQLDEFAKTLRTDRDHRTKDSLNLLRSLRDEFEQLTARPGLEMRSARFREQIGQVLNASVLQLRESYRLFERSEAVVAEARQKVVQQREQVVAEVVVAVDRLQKIVDQFRAITREDSPDLNSLQKELDESLEIAKRTEERMRELENPNKNYESFVKE
jgi:signal transduction histidine kinase